MPLNEQERVQQGGMGYMAYHATLTWMRELAEYGRRLGYESTEHGRPEWVGQMVWDYPKWKLSFDHGSLGHLLISIDGGATWYGMDMTFYPPSEAWDRMLSRVDYISHHGEGLTPVNPRG